MIAALVAGVGAATVLGLTNGVLIAKVRLPPFIVTLAMMIAARGAVLGATGEASVGIESRRNRRHLARTRRLAGSRCRS